MSGPLKRKTMRLALAGTVGLFALVLSASQPAFAVILDILNEPVPGTDRIVLVEGDPVEVSFDVDPAERSSALDWIRLRRLDDASTVSQEVRGERLSGTVSLDTSRENALGELEVVYVYFPTDTVLAVAEGTVLVEPVPPTRVVVPSPEAPTIQAGIDLVADGGTVEIDRGVYEELLLIGGKQVNLVGSGSHGRKCTTLAGPVPEEVVPLEEAVGVITYAAGGGGLLADLAVRGGDVGVAGVEDDAGLPAAVQIEDVVIRQSGRGIAGEFSLLAVEDTEVAETLWHGVSIVKVMALEMIDDLITDTEGVGILVFNFDPPPGTINIVNQILVFNSDGGIVVAGGAKPVYITDCGVGWGELAGILLVCAGMVEIKQTHVAYIFEAVPPGYGPIADGLIALDSWSVKVQDSSFLHCQRAGLLYSGSGGMILDTQSTDNKYGLVIPDEPLPYYQDPENVFLGTEHNIILPSSSLPIPDAPMEVPEP